MPLTDSYGQGIPYPTLADVPNAQTMGEAIVNGLTPRSIMQFPSASVRGATIKTPVAGMVTWLADVKRLEVYDGTAWVSFAFGTNQWRTIPLSSGWSTGTDLLGPFQYRVVNFFGEAAIMFRGGITRSSAWPNPMPDFFVLNSQLLPVDARPSVQRTILVPCSDAQSDRIALKMDVKPDGRITLYGTTSTNRPPWAGFDGCIVSL